MIGEAMVALGAVLAAIAALGAVRLGDMLARTHALTKAALGQAYADQVAKRGDTDYASIMEGGDDIRIQHYVTMWSTLVDASAKAAVPAPLFGQADWKFLG